MRQSISVDVGPVTSVAFSRDGKTLAAAGEFGTMQLWDVPSRRPIGRIAQIVPLGATSLQFEVNSVAFSPDGKTLASGSADHTVRLWNVTYLTDTVPYLCASVGPVAYAP